MKLSATANSHVIRFENRAEEASNSWGPSSPQSPLTGGIVDQPHCVTIHDASTGPEDELHGDINTNMTAPSFSPVHFDKAKGPANDVQTAEDRGMLNKNHCIIIQGLPESSDSTPRERVAADLEQFQKLLNEILQPTEDVTVLKAFRLGSRTNAAPQTRPRALKIVLGPDAIPPKLLKELAPEMSKPLALILHTSFVTGCLPSDWKSATITPLFKGGSRASANNYRPVSLTSICCKIMEKIIKKALMQFLEQHHPLSDAQHGFRSGRSCLTNLLFTLERWTKARDEGNVVHAIYIDFKTALDSLSHQRLLHKLRNGGISGCLLVWIQSFLAGRSQIVQVGRQQSSEVGVVSGVPQGSVLGPTLFLVFINDCVKDLDCDAILFVDDIKLRKVIHNAADADHLQANLNRLEDWSKRWLMPFNISKCNFLQLGSSRASIPRTYFLHDIPLQQVDSQKDLGVWIASSLKRTLRCAKAAKLATATLQLIKRAFMGFDPDCFSKIFETFARPHLECAIQAWRPWAAKDYTVLGKVQRRATKMTQGLGALPYETRLSTLKLFPLSYRQLRGDHILTFRIINGLDCCLDPTDYFTQANTPTLRGHPLKLREGKAGTNGRKFFFSNRVVAAWNALPTDVAAASCVNFFKCRLDAYQASQLPATHPLT
ncbi:hypothetical protein SprV_0200721900 [Sparganum proliferum]